MKFYVQMHKHIKITFALQILSIDTDPIENRILL